MSLKQSVLRFKYDDFAGISESVETTKCSEEKTDSHGNSWRLQMIAKHSDDPVPNKNAVQIGLFLENRGKEAISTKYSIILRDADGRVHNELTNERKFEPNRAYGYRKFIKRSTVLDENNNILLRKALHVDVHLQNRSGDDFVKISPSPSFFADKLLKLLEKEEDVDVSFEIEDTIIHAHKFVLKLNAPTLFGFCGEKDDESPIPVNEITAEIFMIILRYIYAEEVPKQELVESDGKEILDAANRFGLLGLKLFIEASLVQFVDLDSAVGWLLFADSKVCPLLKEYAMSFIVARSEDILNSGTFQEQLQDSPQLMMEVMKEFSKSSNNDQRFDHVKYFSVNDLRKQLHTKGLDIDGTKEMLVARLIQSNEKAED